MKATARTAVIAGALLAGLGVAIWLKRAPAARPPLPALPVVAGDPVAECDAALRRDLDALTPEQRSTLDAALAALGQFGAAGADALQDGERAIPALPGAAGALTEIAVDPEAPPLRRVDACRLLGILRERRAIPALGRLLRVTEPRVPPHVQAAAAEALGRIGDRAALVVLLPPLHDNRPPDWALTTAVGIASLRLGARHGGQACVDVLSDWAADLAARPRVFDRELAARALRELGERVGIAAPANAGNPYQLPTALRAEVEAWTTWWHRVEFRLVTPPDVTTDATLMAALLQPHLATFSGERVFYRKIAQDLIVDCGAEGRAQLLHALRDARPAFRRYAAEALGATHTGDVVPFLVDAFDFERMPAVRIEIVRALRALQGASVVGADHVRSVSQLLEAARSDSDPGVRDAAN